MEKAYFPEGAGPWHKAGGAAPLGALEAASPDHPQQGCEKCLLPQDGLFSAQALLLETESLYKLFFCFVCVLFGEGGVTPGWWSEA